MFKSIEYRLYFFLLLLIASVVGATFFFIKGEYIYAGFCVFMVFISLNRLHIHYKKFNTNILFLLNALDNGDYSFNFAVTKLSRRERELNKMMNRIKEILSKARQEVIEKEKFLTHIIADVPTGIIILDEKNNIRNVNKETVRLLGLPVFTHLNQLNLIDKDLPQLFRELKVSDEGKQIKIVNERDISQINLSISQIKIQNETLRIITLNNIGNELEKREMESWIKLIRVMTHEIMNSIAPITSLTEMLLLAYQSGNNSQPFDELKETTIDSLSTINSTAKDLSTFVESYRQFSGVSSPTLTSIEALPFITSILHLEKVEIDENNVEASVISEKDNLVISGDKTQLTRVIVNLLKNAIEALKETDTKKIRITIGQEINDKIHIDIANNGTPIPPEVLENIFIPFFTTKDSGSGIGLSVSRYIMRLHEGNLKHIFEDGWTIFRLTLKAGESDTASLLV